jgi:hypothetical protein
MVFQAMEISRSLGPHTAKGLEPAKSALVFRRVVVSPESGGGANLFLAP